MPKFDMGCYYSYLVAAVVDIDCALAAVFVVFVAGAVPFVELAVVEFVDFLLVVKGTVTLDQRWMSLRY